ncbi:hypothetical protein LCGC14_1869150, partial [marine sediment metagenome]
FLGILGASRDGRMSQLRDASPIDQNARSCIKKQAALKLRVGMCILSGES